MLQDRKGVVPQSSTVCDLISIGRERANYPVSPTFKQYWDQIGKQELSDALTPEIGEFLF